MVRIHLFDQSIYFYFAIEVIAIVGTQKIGVGRGEGGRVCCRGS